MKNVDIAFTPEFNKALANTLMVEGVYSIDPLDKGGETYMGISRYYHPHWPGWIVIDNHDAKNINGTIEALGGMVKMFYLENFWDRIQGDKVASFSISVAVELFDTAVNFGVSRAVEFFQKALNMQNNSGEAYSDIVVDGKLGPKTLATLKRCLEIGLCSKEDNELILLNCMNGEQYIAYKNNPQHEYYRGWFKRV